MCTCVCVLHNAWDYGDMVAEAWILVYPALEGVLAKLVFVCVCSCKSVGKCAWTRGCGHAALADGITAMPGHPG